MYQVEDIARSTTETGSNDYFAEKFGWMQWGVMKSGRMIRYIVRAI